MNNKRGYLNKGLIVVQTRRGSSKQNNTSGGERYCILGAGMPGRVKMTQLLYDMGLYMFCHAIITVCRSVSILFLLYILCLKKKKNAV